nr:hypothetical protein [Micromonospora provocatoris]
MGGDVGGEGRQPPGQDPAQLDQGSRGGLGRLPLLGHPEPDDQGDHLVVVEHHRRHPGAHRQPVVAPGPRPAHHLVTEFGKSPQVAAQGARADAGALGEFGRRPGGPGLEQGQQEQGAGGDIVIHDSTKDARRCGRNAGHIRRWSRVSRSRVRAATS